jgi:hypothetical protein
VDQAFLIKTAASAVGIVLLVALAAWARIARPTPPLDEAAVRDLLAFEHPGVAIGELWLSDDGAGAIVRSGEAAIIVFRSGDGYVTRTVSWSAVVETPARDGVVALRLADVGASRARFRLAAVWPPATEAAA